MVGDGTADVVGGQRLLRRVAKRLIHQTYHTEHKQVVSFTVLTKASSTNKWGERGWLTYLIVAAIFAGRFGFGLYFVYWSATFNNFVLEDGPLRTWNQGSGTAAVAVAAQRVGILVRFAAAPFRRTVSRFYRQPEVNWCRHAWYDRVTTATWKPKIIIYFAFDGCPSLLDLIGSLQNQKMFHAQTL